MKLFEGVCLVSLAFTAAVLGWYQLRTENSAPVSSEPAERFSVASNGERTSSSTEDVDADENEDDEGDTGRPEIMFSDDMPEIAPTIWGVGDDIQYRENQAALDATSEEVFFGNELKPGAMPEVVALNQTGAAATNGLCTGTLISKRMAVTAMHCVADGVRKILIGDSVTTASTVYDIVEPISVSPPAAALDIAVVLLDRDVENITPAKIAPNDWIDNATWIAVAGYGASENRSTTRQGRKLYAAIPVATTDCSRTDVLGYSDSQLYGCNPGFELVAKGVFETNELARIEKSAREKIENDPGGGKAVDTCKGDSGAGAFVTEPTDHKTASEFAQAVLGERYLAAVTSRVIRMDSAIKSDRESKMGNRFTNCGDGGIYVRLTPEVISIIRLAANAEGQKITIGPLERTAL